MKKYTQLTEVERARIYEGLKKKQSKREIAESIDRSASTIIREIRRNSDQIGYLYPRDAHAQTKARKATHDSKINRNEILKKCVISGLKDNNSPAVIAAVWNKQQPKKTISAETIYRFIYDPDNKHLSLWKNLSKKKRKRGIPYRKPKKSPILHRISLAERPLEINQRTSFGHYEIDLFFNQGSQSHNVLVMVERLSRKVILKKQYSKKAFITLKNMKLALGADMQSCTFDNGLEFAQHYKLGKPTYFCDPHSPWQKGSVENINSLLRRYLPFKLEARIITQDYLDQIAHKLNNTPRKILNFLTPNEVFKKHTQKTFKLNTLPLELDYQKFLNVALHI